MLRRSVEHSLLPFTFKVDDTSAYNVEFMNYSLYCSSDLTDSEDGDQENQFGPPACIGVEFLATQNYQFGEPDRTGRTNENVEQQFLLDGLCPKGTKLLIRLAHPTSDTDSDRRSEIPGLFHHVELGINGTVVTF